MTSLEAAGSGPPVEWTSSILAKFLREDPTFLHALAQDKFPDLEHDAKVQILLALRLLAPSVRFSELGDLAISKVVAASQGEEEEIRALGLGLAGDMRSIRPQFPLIDLTLDELEAKIRAKQALSAESQFDVVPLEAAYLDARVREARGSSAEGPIRSAEPHLAIRPVPILPSDSVIDPKFRLALGLGPEPAPQPRPPLEPPPPSVLHQQGSLPQRRDTQGAAGPGPGSLPARPPSVARLHLQHAHGGRSSVSVGPKTSLLGKLDVAQGGTTQTQGLGQGAGTLLEQDREVSLSLGCPPEGVEGAPATSAPSFEPHPQSGLREGQGGDAEGRRDGLPAEGAGELSVIGLVAMSPPPDLGPPAASHLVEPPHALKSSLPPLSSEHDHKPSPSPAEFLAHATRRKQRSSKVVGLEEIEAAKKEAQKSRLHFKEEQQKRRKLERHQQAQQGQPEGGGGGGGAVTVPSPSSPQAAKGRRRTSNH